MSVQVAFLLDPDDDFQSGHTFRDPDGVVQTGVRIDGPRYGSANTILGPPTELRRLAAALILAADKADAWARSQPPEEVR